VEPPALPRLIARGGALAENAFEDHVAQCARDYVAARRGLEHGKEQSLDLLLADVDNDEAQKRVAIFLMYLPSMAIAAERQAMAAKRAGVSINRH
jgi:hypothetical protein